MESTSSSLGDKFASLRGTAQEQETCAWIPDSVHALIIACLARIFARLEQIFLLWQTGQLPPPQARSTQRPTARRNAARRNVPRQNRAPLLPAPAPRARRHKSRVATPPPAQCPAPLHTIIPSARPRPAHDPPAAMPAKNGQRTASSNRAIFVTLSL